MLANTLEIDITKKIGPIDLSIQQTLDLSKSTGLFGASGSGKTSLLRLISGLDKPDSGNISVIGSNGERHVWFDSSKDINLSASKRNVGYMIQGDQLFEHLNVFQNLQYANKRNKAHRTLLDFETVVKTLDLSKLLKQSTGNLSGGEKQRVALGRTLLTNPSLLLLDEPLTGLDRSKKMEIMPYLEKLRAAHNLPILYVSHDVDEVVRMTQNIIVLCSGMVLNHGKTKDFLNALPSFDLGIPELNDVTVLYGKIEHIDSELMLATINVLGQHLYLPIQDSGPQSKEATIHIHAHDVSISLNAPHSTSVRNIIPCTIKSIESVMNSPFSNLVLSVGKHTILSRITRASVMELSLENGADVYAMIKSASFANRLS